jgi:hypothetical protein
VRSGRTLWLKLVGIIYTCYVYNAGGSGSKSKKGSAKAKSKNTKVSVSSAASTAPSKKLSGKRAALSTSDASVIKDEKDGKGKTKKREDEKMDKQEYMMKEGVVRIMDDFEKLVTEICASPALQKTSTHDQAEALAALAHFETQFERIHSDFTTTFWKIEKRQSAKPAGLAEMMEKYKKQFVSMKAMLRLAKDSGGTDFDVDRYDRSSDDFKKQGGHFEEPMFIRKVAHSFANLW